MLYYGAPYQWSVNKIIKSLIFLAREEERFHKYSFSDASLLCSSLFLMPPLYFATRDSWRLENVRKIRITNFTSIKKDFTYFY